MTIKEKNELLDRLSVCYNRANYCKMLCDEKGNKEQAAQCDRRKKRLMVEIDGLLQDLYQDWIGRAEQLKPKLDKANTEIDKLIEKIEKDIECAQNIVKIIGYIDDVVKLAADMVK